MIRVLLVGLSSVDCSPSLAVFAVMDLLVIPRLRRRIKAR